MIGVGRQTCTNPQSAVRRQRYAHARRVYRIRYVDVSRNLAVNGVAGPAQLFVALNANEDLIGRELNTDVIRVIVVTSQVQHDLQHLVSVVCTHINKAN